MAKVFIINLELDSKKREYITGHFKERGISFELINAIDGRELSSDELNKLVDLKKAKEYNKNSMALGEIGCALSHCLIYKKIIDDNLDGAFIFEDDIILPKNMKEIINSIYKQRDKIPKNSYISFNRSYIYFLRKVINITNDIGVYRTHLSHGTIGYYIDKQAAQTLLIANTKIKYTADNQQLVKKINRLSTNKVLLELNNSFDSTINQTRVIAHPKKNIIKRCFRAFRDKFIRKKLSSLSIFVGIKRIT